MDTIGDIIVNGDPVAPEDAVISVLDLGFQRGYGCFEALRSYGGKPFRLAAHLDRLVSSAAALHLPEPDRSLLETAVRDRAAAGGNCIVRVFVSGGTDVRNLGAGSTSVVLAEELPPVRDTIRIEPRTAPWHTDGAPWELTGAKTLSYGPNLAAFLAAKRSGFDDALLIGRGGYVLEGPTFSIGWVRNGIVETPCMDLGILASITRSAAIDVAGRLDIDLVEGEYDLDHVLAADEVFVLSTVKEVMPVVAIGDQQFEPGRVTARLARGFRELVAEELDLD
ncbi:MAG: aminotransferase class IV [Acidimicrobiia bacterium]|nr:aminotransferase class IV [Acidimicrobiia bacterium]